MEPPVTAGGSAPIPVPFHLFPVCIPHLDFARVFFLTGPPKLDKPKSEAVSAEVSKIAMAKIQGRRIYSVYTRVGRRLTPRTCLGASQLPGRRKTRARRFSQSDKNLSPYKEGCGVTDLRSIFEDVRKHICSRKSRETSEKRRYAAHANCSAAAFADVFRALIEPFWGTFVALLRHNHTAFAHSFTLSNLLR